MHNACTYVCMCMYVYSCVLFLSMCVKQLLCVTITWSRLCVMKLLAVNVNMHTYICKCSVRFLEVLMCTCVQYVRMFPSHFL